MADLVSGVLVGVTEKTVSWLDHLMRQQGPRHVLLVVVCYPAGPTREEHLVPLQQLQGRFAGPEQCLEVRLLPVSRAYAEDSEKPILPPTIIQAYDSRTGKTTLCIGSIGDAGSDEMLPASFNVVFEPDDALRDAWRRWFQYLFDSATRLTQETVRIPHLVPAQGDPNAAEAWQALHGACEAQQRVESACLTVNRETGEVELGTDAAGPKGWDGGKTKLDPLAQTLQRVYAGGWLVTMDEATRIRPLTIP
jgi:hypothetical protein